MSEDTAADEGQTEEFLYIAPNHPNLKFRIDEFQYAMDGGAMRIDAEEAEALDKFLASKKGAAMRMMIRRVDYAEAARIALQHVNVVEGRAVKGAMTSADMDLLRQEKMKAGSQFAHLTSQEEIDRFSDELAHGDMLLQEGVDLPEQKAAPSPDPQLAETPSFGKPD